MTKPNKPIPPTPRLSPRQIRVLAGRLLTWYDSDKRDLPWRRTCDPYAILVSEFMLQQTQVATVIPYFERFMAAFPTVRALAAAPEQQVLRLWAGLGYYGRARHLHAAARRIVEAYGGRIPPRVGDLLFLPGVGSYVAGAVASIAFGVPVPAVDANVARVLSRLFALTGDPASPRVRKDLESLAAALIPPERPGDFNQAMMELGARVCAATRPLCDPCPVRSSCKAAQQGNPLDYPAPARRPETVEVEEALAVVRVEDRASAPAVVRAGDRVDARAGAPAVVRSEDRAGAPAGDRAGAPAVVRVQDRAGARAGAPPAVRSEDRYLIVQRPGDSGRYRNMWEFPHIQVGEARERSRTAAPQAPDSHEFTPIDASSREDGSPPSGEDHPRAQPEISPCSSVSIRGSTAFSRIKEGGTDSVTRKKDRAAHGREASRTGDRAARALADFLRDDFRLEVRVDEEWAEIRHQVTHHKIRKRVFLCSLADEKAEKEVNKKVAEKPDKGLNRETRVQTTDSHRYTPMAVSGRKEGSHPLGEGDQGAQHEIYPCSLVSIRGSTAVARMKEEVQPADTDTLRWVTLEDLSHYPLGAPHRRILALLHESAKLFPL